MPVAEKKAAARRRPLKYSMVLRCYQKSYWIMKRTWRGAVYPVAIL